MRIPGKTSARRAPARERLLEAAARRFYTSGIAATGIDAITAEAGVAKMSLYNNFASKSALVDAYIDARHREWLGLCEARCAGSTNPTRRVLAVFDAYLDHAGLAWDHGFRGCGLLNAAAELPVGDPGREAVRRHKEQVQEILRAELVELTDEDSAARLAEHFSFLLEGSMTRAGLEGTQDRLASARRFAEEMLLAL